MVQRVDPTVIAHTLNAVDAETRISANEAVLAGTRAPVTVAAFGTTQGTATLIPAGVDIIVTVTASTEGVKLPVATTGRTLTIFADPAVGVKVYPNTNAKIEAAATNVAVALVKAKATRFYAKNTTQWLAHTGA